MTLTLAQSIDATRHRIQQYAAIRGKLNTPATQKLLDTLDNSLPHHVLVMLCYDALCSIHTIMLTDETTTVLELEASANLIMDIRFSILNWLAERI